MNTKKQMVVGFMAGVIALGLTSASVAGEKKAAAQEGVALDAAGTRLEAQYADQLKALQADIERVLPKIDEQKKSALRNAREAVKKAEAALKDGKAPLDEVGKQKAILDNNKKFWVKNAEKQIAKAQADLKAATTDSARAAAQKTLSEQQKRLAAGIAAVKEREAHIEKLKASLGNAGAVTKAAQETLEQARANELKAAQALLASLEPFLASDKLDAKLVKCDVLAEATPRGLAAFAQQGAEQTALVNQLLANDKLMKEMLIAGGAEYGKYGRAMEIYTAIQKASPKAGQGLLQRLALATSLEHAVPIKQTHAEDQTDAPATVDPVKRYLQYEKAYLDGKLDPAFKDLTTWEYRMVVNSDVPDEILVWGREMLRNYRPDHIYTPNYGWRYSATVKTEVPYGSQNVKNDLPSLHSVQNIIKDGGVCGRRAFFGRFILRSFGIPVWGVTQHAHAALSHWTPKGWVVNLGAGFNASWWDKDEFSLGGSDFLLETQAREHTQDYLKVLRARWVSRILGEPAYNGRKGVDGGLWSSAGHYQAVVIASKSVELGPLGQELAEANEPEEKQNEEQATVTDADKKLNANQTGVITIPVVAHKQATGSGAAMKSFAGGMQMHCRGGFKAQYAFDAPQAGKYALTARVATVQEGQKFLFATNDAKQPVEIAVPFTIGMWQQTSPVVMALSKGQNVLQFALKDGSRGVTIKDFTFTPMK